MDEKDVIIGGNVMVVSPVEGVVNDGVNPASFTSLVVASFMETKKWLIHIQKYKMESLSLSLIFIMNFKFLNLIFDYLHVALGAFNFWSLPKPRNYFSTKN